MTRFFEDGAWADALPSGPLVLVLDFDGTLVEIAETPDAIVVPDDLSARLDALSARGHDVVILTGRNASFVVERLGHARERIVGLHGLEWPGEEAPARHPALDEAKVHVAESLARTGGAPDAFLVEDKGLAVAFHWRRVHERERARVIEAVSRALAPLAQGALVVLDGHMMKELRPRAASKGRAIARLASASRARPLVFVGDDLTDEEGFAALPPSGVAVRVGPQDVETRASLVVRDPRAVRDGLARLAARAA